MGTIIEIGDFDAPELDVYARLSERELLRCDEPLTGLFIAESPKVVERALSAGYEPVSLLMEPRHVEGEARELVNRCNVPVYIAPLDVLTRLVGFQLTRGVLCAMRRRREPAPEEICRAARRVAVLEDVMNPTNVGAIFRSAAALGIDAVLLTSACADPLYRRAVRVSMGNVFALPWAHVGDDWAARLHDWGFQTAAMALSDDSVPISAPFLRKVEKLAIVLGTEGDGLARHTIAACDHTVRIPMSRGVDSLNVAAASAVAFWELAAKNDVQEHEL
ncbi:MAG: RNA methyltransferase [Oscillospiraceae bacterium]|nr:RNA methyltransferase [Oscillospiraceae bacterium]